MVGLEKTTAWALLDRILTINVPDHNLPALGPFNKLFKLSRMKFFSLAFLAMFV